MKVDLQFNLEENTLKKIIITLKEKRNIEFIISCIVAWTILLITISGALGSDNLIYAIGEKRAFNESLFHNNVYLGEGVISPRYIIDFVFKIIMKINGGNWAGAALVWIYSGAAIQAWAIANISRKISEERQIAVAAIFSTLILYCDNYLAGFSLVGLASTSIGTALAFSFLSISFIIGENRNYKIAWLLASCSIICHIHEGIYCCAIIFIFAVVDSIMQRRIIIKENWTVLIALVTVLIVIGPSMLTDSLEITGAEFVYIYSILRHPHHLMPSSWGMDAIYKTIWIDICFMLLGIQSIAINSKEKVKEYLLQALFLVVAWILAILLMYIFTEKKPLVIVSTMFLSKSFKFVLLIAIIWLIKAAFDMYKKEAYISCYAVLGFGFFASDFDLTGILIYLIITAVAVSVENFIIENGRRIIPKDVAVYFDVIFFAGVICAKQAKLGQINGAVVVLVFFAVLVIGIVSSRKMTGYKFLICAACVCMLLLSLLNRVIIHHSGTTSFSIITGEKALRYSMGNELYDLAIQFRNDTEVSDEFLADPNAEVETGWFQVVSERNCLVVEKVIPSSKRTVDDWYERYLQTVDFDKRTAEELLTTMKTFNINYILVDTDNYQKLDETKNFIIYMQAKDDSYRVYKLRD